jgi:hypothetical protein
VRGENCTVVVFEVGTFVFADAAREFRMCPGVRVPHQFRPRKKILKK